jgi:hypothetical protein
MPISAYPPTSGASFSPESVTNMQKAHDDAVDILGIGPSDETKREAAARFIIKLAKMGAWMLRVCVIRPLWLWVARSISLHCQRTDNPDANRS